MENQLNIAANLRPMQPIAEPDLGKIYNTISNATLADARAKQANAQAGMYTLQQAKQTREFAAQDQFHRDNDLERLATFAPQSANAVTNERFRQYEARKPYVIGSTLAGPTYGVPTPDGGFRSLDPYTGGFRGQPQEAQPVTQSQQPSFQPIPPVDTGGEGPATPAAFRPGVGPGYSQGGGYTPNASYAPWWQMYGPSSVAGKPPASQHVAQAARADEEPPPPPDGKFLVTQDDKDEWKKAWQGWKSGVAPPGAVTNAAAGPKYNEAAIAQLSPNEQDYIRRFARGLENPVGMNRSVQGQKVLQFVSGYYKDWNSAIYGQRSKTLTNFSGSGLEARNFVSNDMALQHLGGALNNLEKLNNSDIPAVNWIKNTYKYQTGDKDFQEARRQFGVDVDAIGNELMRTFRGSGSPSEKEAVEWREKLNEYDSPVAIRSALREAAKLLASRTAASAKMYNDSMGPEFERSPESWLSKQGQISLRRALTLDPQKEVPPHIRDDVELQKLGPGKTYLDYDGTPKVKPAAPSKGQQGEPAKVTVGKPGSFVRQNGHIFEQMPDGSRRYVGPEK